MNYDYPQPMHAALIKQKLARLAMDAQKFYAVLDDEDQLPAWVQMQVNIAEDRLHTASDYIRHKARPGVDAYEDEPTGMRRTYKGIDDVPPRQQAEASILSIEERAPEYLRYAFYGLAGVGVYYVLKTVFTKE